MSYNYNYKDSDHRFYKDSDHRFDYIIPSTTDTNMYTITYDSTSTSGSNVYIPYYESKPVTFEYKYDFDAEKEDLRSENDLLKKTIQSLLELYCGGEEKE
jgi:hypothetical protein